MNMVVKRGIGCDVAGMRMVVSILACMLMQSVTAGISLNRIFHHKGDGASPQLTDKLEIAQLVFYFDKQPLVHKGHKDTRNGIEHVELFFPDAQLQDRNNAAKKFGHEHGMYAVALEQTATGVKCSVSFNPRSIVFDYDAFLSISSQYAVRLNFLNKSLLDLMKRPGTLLRVTQLEQKPCIVIDCGHGGRDTGARSVHGIYEKDLTLSVGKEVAALLERSGFKVCMTRKGDNYVKLDDRTSYANASGATAFISIHANASNNVQACGVEAFYLDSALFSRFGCCEKKYEIAVAQHQDEIFARGQRLAHCVCKGVLDSVRTEKFVTSGKIRPAVAQVLVGSQAPAALIEFGYLSHACEELLLADRHYQHLIAQGISTGIMNYYAQCAMCQV